MQPEITIKISFPGLERPTTSIVEREENETLGIKTNENLQFEVPSVPGLLDNESLAEEPFVPLIQETERELSVPFEEQEIDNLTVPSDEEILSNHENDDFIAPPEIEDELVFVVEDGFDYSPPEVPVSTESRLIDFESQEIPSDFQYEYEETQEVFLTNDNEGYGIPPLPEN